MAQFGNYLSGLQLSLIGYTEMTNHPNRSRHRLSDDQIRRMALYGSTTATRIKIDDNAKVLRDNQGGAWVKVWVYVHFQPKENTNENA